MDELIRLLTSWRGAQPPPKPAPAKPTESKPKYPAGATEAEKLQIAKDRIRKQREAEAAAGPKDIGGPFGELPGKIGIGMQKVAGEKPDPKARKPWYKRGLYDLF